MKFFDKILFRPALRLAELGDAFVMNAIVHKFAQEANHLILPVKKSNFETIESLYQDYSNIELFPYSDLKDVYNFFISTEDPNLTLLNQIEVPHTNVYIQNLSNQFSKAYVPINWDRQVYEYYDLPFSTRYTGFRFPKKIDGSDELYDQLTSGDDNYVLLHRGTSQYPNGINMNFDEFRKNMNLPERKIIEIKVGITKNMLQYIKLIENAKEIHCVPSSLFCLADSIFNRISGQLFFHDLRANTMMKVNSRWNDNKWSIVNYDRKL
jgi:hypothetical protein